ncbi:MAG TPA: CAP domain-containing protein [Thermoanaerobaculia bacterium]|nr:CAP domain-containing protein [Thermoanaerobaculia bacterium]
MPRSNLSALSLCLLVLALTAVGPPDPSDRRRAVFLESINAARGQAPPLSLSAALSRVAEARAEELSRSGRNPRDTSIAEAMGLAAKAEYDARFLSEIFISGNGAPETVLGQSVHGAGPLAQAIARREMRDLGIGFAPRDHPSLYVFVFGLDWQTFLSAKREEFADLARVRRDLLERINRERIRRKLPRFRPDPKLDLAAQKHARDMLARSYYAHKSPEGTTVLERAQDAGYRPRFVGENLAQGQESIDQVVEGWMASAVHREHVLSAGFSDIGSGVAVGSNRQGHQILWVQCFGRSRD